MSAVVHEWGHGMSISALHHHRHYRHGILTAASGQTAAAANSNSADTGNSPAVAGNQSAGSTAPSSGSSPS